MGWYQKYFQAFSIVVPREDFILKPEEGTLERPNTDSGAGNKFETPAYGADNHYRQSSEPITNYVKQAVHNECKLPILWMAILKRYILICSQRRQYQLTLQKNTDSSEAATCLAGGVVAVLVSRAGCGNKNDHLWDGNMILANAG